MVVFPSRTTNTLPAAVATSSCVSADDPALTSSAAASSSAAARAKGSPSASVEPTTLPLSSKTTAVWICDETSVRSASACCASIRLQSRVRPVRVRRRDLWGKFYADRGTHLAAMIAYFALLAFVPLTFLALALLGLTGRADESSFLVKEIKHALPGTPIDRIVGLVHSVQDNAAALGIVGGVALLWTSLSLFSALESAFNIVYGRPNRSFLHGKGIAAMFMVATITPLFASIVVGALGVEVVKRYAPGFAANTAAG